MEERKKLVNYIIDVMDEYKTIIDKTDLRYINENLNCPLDFMAYCNSDDISQYTDIAPILSRVRDMLVTIKSQQELLASMNDYIKIRDKIIEKEEEYER